MSNHRSNSPFKHLQRSRADWNLFLRAYALVWFIRLALWVRPFPQLHAWTTKVRQAQTEAPALDSQSVYKIIWAVSAAARRVPKATCLTQALATQIMLGRRGHQTTLQFGAKKEAGKLDAHAWLEREGEVLIGFNDSFDDLIRFQAPPGDRSKIHKNGG